MSPARTSEDTVDPSAFSHQDATGVDDDRYDGRSGIQLDAGIYLLVVKPQLTINLELRSNRRGDLFWPAWKDYPIKLIDFIRGQKVDSQHRYSIPVVTVSIDGMTDSIVACMIPVPTGVHDESDTYRVFVSKPYTEIAQISRIRPAVACLADTLPVLYDTALASIDPP